MKESAQKLNYFYFSAPLFTVFGFISSPYWFCIALITLSLGLINDRKLVLSTLILIAAVSFGLVIVGTQLGERAADRDNQLSAQTKAGGA